MKIVIDGTEDEIKNTLQAIVGSKERDDLGISSLHAETVNVSANVTKKNKSVKDGKQRLGDNKIFKKEYVEHSIDLSKGADIKIYENGAVEVFVNGLKVPHVKRIEFVAPFINDFSDANKNTLNVITF